MNASHDIEPRVQNADKYVVNFTVEFTSLIRDGEGQSSFHG
jgi:hypothetical protein